jgi:hypothetical protein
MSRKRRYRKRAQTTVVAVKLDLETEGFVYQKWGGTQTCRPGDWLVCNQGDTYTVAADTFQHTYREVSSGVFEKTAEIWAEIAEEAGSVDTKEGVTHYERGDYLVHSAVESDDAYAISAESFTKLYEVAD